MEICVIFGFHKKVEKKESILRAGSRIGVKTPNRGPAALKIDSYFLDPRKQ